MRPLAHSTIPHPRREATRPFTMFENPFTYTGGGAQPWTFCAARLGSGRRAFRASLDRGALRRTVRGIAVRRVHDHAPLPGSPASIKAQ